MEKDISSIPIDILASIISIASQDVADIVDWRITSRSFKDACMQVLAPHACRFLCKFCRLPMQSFMTLLLILGRCLSLNWKQNVHMDPDLTP